jgi:putative oxidoreductase
MLKGFPVNVDLGLLVIRLMIGFVGIYHGSQKLFAWPFGGGGIAGTAEFMTKLNLPAPTAAAVAAGSAEFFGGLLLALGLFARIGAVFFAFTMGVAVFMVHWKSGFGAQSGGYEYPMTLMAVLIGLVISGPGRYAITPRL